jgi:ABC-type antimicrobial peptide transport system permease subunit
MKTMQGHLEDSLQQPRLTARVLTGFALLALVLAASGLYSLCNLTVLSRTREIGTRMALGARGTQVVQAVLSQATATLMAGVCAGIGLALGAGVLIKSQLFSVGSFDTETFGTVLVVLITSAFTAMLVPALRAARIDPVKAMRQQ